MDVKMPRHPMYPPQSTVAKAAGRAPGPLVPLRCPNAEVYLLRIGEVQVRHVGPRAAVPLLQPSGLHQLVDVE